MNRVFFFLSKNEKRVKYSVLPAFELIFNHFVEYISLLAGKFVWKKTDLREKVQSHASTRNGYKEAKDTVYGWYARTHPAITNDENCVDLDLSSRISFSAFRKSVKWKKKNVKTDKKSSNLLKIKKNNKTFDRINLFHFVLMEGQICS